MLNCTDMVKEVVKVKTLDGDRISGYLVEIIDQKYLKLRFRSGVEAFLAINDIAYIAPVQRQPPVVI
jgi:hypothetical protein